MASPLKSGKQSVDLASSGPRVSRIRRDPPPAVKQLEVRSHRENERSDVVVGVIVFALAIFVIIIAFGSYSGWSLRQYKVELTTAE
ncbi:MAG TPA: hypothetical protein VGD23_05960 [Sphingomicrobium sp.]